MCRHRSRLGLAIGSVCHDLWQDVRYGARVFSKQPAFAAAAVLTLALGIGATTAIFSVVYGVLLKPLPFDEPERLVSRATQSRRTAPARITGPATYFTYRENQQRIRGDRRMGSDRGVDHRTRRAGTRRSDCRQPHTLPLLRVHPILGRCFSAEDDTPGAPLRVVLTHGYWQRRFAGAETSSVSQLMIDGSRPTVIGVLPASFSVPAHAIQRSCCLCSSIART